MLELVKNIEFVKKNKLKLNKISEKEFILENKNEKYTIRSAFSPFRPPIMFYACLKTSD